MRVVQATRFGGPEVLELSQRADPVAGPGEVVIDVAVAPTLFLDTQIRSGAATAWFPVTPPYVPGVGVAGTVGSVGPGVDSGWIGRRVVADTGSGYVERALAAADNLVRVPDGLGLAEAAALLTDGRTALRLAEVAAIRPGERVLITAAAGGLGSLLVQLAHSAGAYVVATARGQRKLDLVKKLGADVVVDHSEPGWPNQIAAGPVNVVFDGSGGEIGVAAFERTVDGGRFFAYGAPSGGFAALAPIGAARRGITVHGIDLVQLGPEDAREFTERALAEAVAGRLKPTIGLMAPLKRAAETHAAIEARTVVGKAVLEVSAAPDPFSPAELDYLASQEVGRLATVQPDGTLQVSPVGYRYTADTQTIDIYGYNMSRSRKYHNVADNGRVAFVIDDVPSVEPRRVRCLEIRGYAETVSAPDSARDGLDSAFIRIHPRRIISFGIDDTDQEPHEMTAHNRDVG